MKSEKKYLNIPLPEQGDELRMHPSHCAIVEVLTWQITTKRMVILFDKDDHWCDSASIYSQAEAIVSCIKREQLPRIEREALGHSVKVYKIEHKSIRQIMAYDPVMHGSSTANN